MRHWNDCYTWVLNSGSWRVSPQCSEGLAHVHIVLVIDGLCKKFHKLHSLKGFSRDVFLSGISRGKSIFLPFPASRGVCMPWCMAPSIKFFSWCHFSVSTSSTFWFFTFLLCFWGHILNFIFWHFYCIYVGYHIFNFLCRSTLVLWI